MFEVLVAIMGDPPQLIMLESVAVLLRIMW